MVYSTVRDDTHPHLVIGEHPEVQPWAHGKMFNIRSRSTFLRFSSRGFEYSNAHIHALPKESKWHPQTCTPAPNALCQEILSPAKQLWFPDSVVDVPDDWSQIPQTDITRLVNETRACISTDSQRTINTLDTRYEISLCDLIDSNLNIIYAHDPIDKTPTIHWAQDTTSMYEYFIIAVIALYLVSSVSQNIADMFKIAHDIVAYLDDEIKQTKKQNKLQRIKTRSKKNIHDDDPDNDPDNTDNDEDTNDNEDDEDDDDFDNNNTKKKQKSREKQNKRREEIKLKARKMFTTNTPMYRIQSACIFATFIYTVVNFNFMKRDILISTPDYTLYWHIAIYIILTLGFHWCCARDDDKPRSNQITPFPTFPNEMTDYPPSLPTFLPIPENQMLSLSLRSISVPEMSLMGDRLLPIDMSFFWKYRFLASSLMILDLITSANGLGFLHTGMRQLCRLKRFGHPQCSHIHCGHLDGSSGGFCPATRHTPLSSSAFLTIFSSFLVWSESSAV